MAENNFSVLLEAIIDKSSLTQAQKDLAKQRLKIGVDLDTTSATKNSKKIATELSRITKSNSMRQWADNNSKAMKKYGNEINNLIAKMSNLDIAMDKVESNNILTRFKQIQNEARQTGNIGKTAADKLINAWEKFGGWSLATGAITTSVSKVREAVNELKNLDDILTEINKTSDLTTQELKELGMASYDKASKYGRKASDYLSGVQSMSQSGLYGEKGEAMAEQSLLAQAAGDMSQEIADKYVIATNAAYKFNGEAKKLNDVLDGQNSISNRNSVTLQDMATAMSEAGTVASSYNVAIEDLSAMIGTIESVTKSGGDEVGNSIKSILINLQNVASDKITDTLDKANASMTEFVNGAEKLRNPIDILRDLAKTFNQLNEDDPLRAEILTNVAGKYQAAKLAALLQNMDIFDKMLKDYSEGSGSAMSEAQKSATNLTGSINTLSNSWSELVNTFINSDNLKDGVNLLNALVQGATNLVDTLTPLGTLALGGGIFAGFKNVGINTLVAY